MTSAATLYACGGAAIVAVGFYAMVARRNLIRKIMGLNVMGSGVFLILISMAGRSPGEEPDPVPQAMVLTGLVVAVSATGLGLALVRRLHRETGRLDWRAADDPPEAQVKGEEPDHDR